MLERSQIKERKFLFK